MNTRPSVVLSQNRELIRHIVLSHRSNNPRIFGSVLHGTDTEGSDLDLLIDAGVFISDFLQRKTGSRAATAILNKRHA